MYEKFREAYERGSRETRYIVDLADVASMDSSALGMLLVLRDQRGSDSASVEIAHCSAEVRKILQIANFERLFHIS
jgi:anti-anti-sigma factor